VLVTGARRDLVTVRRWLANGSYSRPADAREALRRPTDLAITDLRWVLRRALSSVQPGSQEHAEVMTPPYPAVRRCA